MEEKEGVTMVDNVENHNELTELSPSEYFEQVKERKNRITDEDLQKVYDNCLEIQNYRSEKGHEKTYVPFGVY